MLLCAVLLDEEEAAAVCSKARLRFSCSRRRVALLAPNSSVSACKDELEACCNCRAREGSCIPRCASSWALFVAACACKSRCILLRLDAAVSVSVAVSVLALLACVVFAPVFLRESFASSLSFCEAGSAIVLRDFSASLKYVG